MSKPEMILFSDSARGVYIPQHFAESVKRACVSGVALDALDALALGPDSSESYWDIWAEVTDSAIVTDSNGVRFRLYQDGDLWLIPEGMEWNEESDSFEWPEEEEEES